ncbi:chemotaxis protein CheX [Rappaport israeli]|uniref:chemotaxis protein CheX n=1 Tax=Rappaport israeli TaxID=1839807 RepID=UPI000930070A|nr:chemotaxis protein CheX [Rappaport israeli]
MKEERMQVFIDGANRFFNEVNNINAEIGTPYLVENDKPKVHDFTGIIGLSGDYKGCVYFTAPRALLRHILLEIGEKNTNKEAMFDLVGEIANTISGNARRVYGESFMISAPIIIEGAPSEIFLPKDSRSYVIPISWQEYTAATVICLQNPK